MPRLLGERIQLREYQADDLESICQWVNDESTTCFLSTAYWPPQTMVDTEEFLQRMLQSSHNAFNFVIADRESGRYLGQLDMFTVDWRLRCGKLGMVIGWSWKSAWTTPPPAAATSVPVSGWKA